MSPSRRYLGTIERVQAVLSYPHLYEIGGELDGERLVGRPPVHPPYVLLLFAALARASRSTVRVETDLASPANWAAVRTQMLTTIRRHRLDLAPPAEQPPGWHHWRRLRDDHLTTDEGLAALARLHQPRAVALARQLGLLDPRGGGSLTHPIPERTVTGDGTIVRPIYRPPRSVTVEDENGCTRVLYPDPATHELLEAPPRRHDPDIAEHHGHKGPVLGHGYVAMHVRARHKYGRVTLGIDHIPQPGQEADTAVRLFGDIHRHASDGIQVLVYDGAMRGTHIDRIMTRHGVLVIADLGRYDAANDPATAALVAVVGSSTRFPSYPLGIATHTAPDGATCSHSLVSINGRPAEVDLDETGDPVVIQRLTRGAVKRSRRKNGRYHFNIGYAVNCPHGDFTTWLHPHAKHDGDPRPEALRVIPADDPDYLALRGIRSDAESVHSGLKRTLISDRSMSLGWRRGLIDYYAYAWYSNALAYSAAEQPESTGHANSLSENQTAFRRR